MNPTKFVFAMVSMASVLAFAGCAAETDEEESVDVDEQGQELTSSLSLPANGTKAFTLRATRTQDVVLTVDCRVPADPDARGTVFKVSSSTLAVASSDPARDGFWQRTASVPAGTHTITFTNQGPAAACLVKTTAVPAASTCRAWSAWHSPNPNHTHFAVGTDTSSDWEPFPASGNHWGAWAGWNKIYDKAVKRGYLLHNLEHGGVVFSYKCESVNGPGCKEARDQLIALAQRSGLSRIYVTPDPTQPQKFGVRAWRWAYTSDCLDETSAKAFAQTHIRHGREDIDGDVPIPFDPSTTNVPCQDLMAAPDSCVR